MPKPYAGTTDMKMKEGYADGGGKSGGAHGPGGLAAANNRRANGKMPGVNDSPDGPSAHMMGYKGDGGMDGKTSVSHRGRNYHFK